MRRAVGLAALAVFAWTAGAARAEDAKDPSFVPGMPNRASVHFEYENFDKDFSPWGLIDLEYSRKLPRATVIGRINQAHRFGKDDTQVEFDAYPKLWTKAYAYLNVGRASSGRSNDGLFPDWRYGAELFCGLPRSFEVSGGLRYLDFPSTQVTLWTGSVAYYWKDWWFSLRPYHARSRNHSGPATVERHSSSANFAARWYFGESIEYLQLSAGKGSAAESGDVLDATRLDDWTAQADVRKLVGPRTMIRGGLGYRGREISGGRTRHSVLARFGIDVFF